MRLLCLFLAVFVWACSPTLTPSALRQPRVLGFDPAAPPPVPALEALLRERSWKIASSTNFPSGAPRTLELRTVDSFCAGGPCVDDVTVRWGAEGWAPVLELGDLGKPLTGYAHEWQRELEVSITRPVGILPSEPRAVLSETSWPGIYVVHGAGLRELSFYRASDAETLLKTLKATPVEALLMRLQAALERGDDPAPDDVRGLRKLPGEAFATLFSPLQERVLALVRSAPAPELQLRLLSGLLTTLSEGRPLFESSTDDDDFTRREGLLPVALELSQSWPEVATARASLVGLDFRKAFPALAATLRSRELARRLTERPSTRPLHDRLRWLEELRGACEGLPDFLHSAVAKELLGVHDALSESLSADARAAEEKGLLATAGALYLIAGNVHGAFPKHTSLSALGAQLDSPAADAGPSRRGQLALARILLRLLPVAQLRGDERDAAATVSNMELHWDKWMAKWPLLTHVRLPPRVPTTGRGPPLVVEISPVTTKLTSKISRKEIDDDLQVGTRQVQRSNDEELGPVREQVAWLEERIAGAERGIAAARGGVVVVGDGKTKSHVTGATYNADGSVKRVLTQGGPEPVYKFGVARAAQRVAELEQERAAARVELERVLKSAPARRTWTESEPVYQRRKRITDVQTWQGWAGRSFTIDGPGVKRSDDNGVTFSFDLTDPSRFMKEPAAKQEAERRYAKRGDWRIIPWLSIAATAVLDASLEAYQAQIAAHPEWTDAEKQLERATWAWLTHNSTDLFERLPPLVRVLHHVNRSQNLAGPGRAFPGARTTQLSAAGERLLVVDGAEVAVFDTRTFLAAPSLRRAGLSAPVAALSATGDSVAFTDAKRPVQVLRATGEELEVRNLPGQGQVSALGFSPDGGALAAGTRDGSVFVARLDGQGVPVELKLASRQVDAVGFSADGARLGARINDAIFTIDLRTMELESRHKPHQSVLVYEGGAAPCSARFCTSANGAMKVEPGGDLLRLYVRIP